jgi:hypothetical protein
MSHYAKRGKFEGGRGQSGDKHQQQQSGFDLQDIKEAEVGISAYVSPHIAGFFGILKQRCLESDFDGYECIDSRL